MEKYPLSVQCTKYGYIFLCKLFFDKCELNTVPAYLFFTLASLESKPNDKTV